METDKKVKAHKSTVRVAHPTDKSMEFILEDVLVIGPETDWATVPSLEQLSGDTSAVLMNFSTFAQLSLNEFDEYEPVTLN
jgi:hypothetical protein